LYPFLTLPCQACQLRSTLLHDALECADLRLAETIGVDALSIAQRLGGTDAAVAHLNLARVYGMTDRLSECETHRALAARCSATAVNGDCDDGTVAAAVSSFQAL
jgi:hypothetical protein